MNQHDWAGGYVYAFATSIDAGDAYALIGTGTAETTYTSDALINDGRSKASGTSTSALVD